MINSNSGKHARKVTLDAAVSNAIAKAVDARKVAAFTVGAAGVLAGASFAFGATPAMAAEVSGTPDTKPDVAQTPVTAGENAGTGKKAEAGDKNQTEANKEAGYKAENTNKQAEQKSENTVNTDGTENKSTVVKIRGKRSVDNPPSGHTATVQDRASGGSAGQDPNKINPDTTDTSNTKIDINENNAETMPNAYAWGSSDNTYSVDGEKHTVTFHFAAPKDGSKITSIAIFPARTNGFNNAKSEKGIDFYSKDQNKHQAYSGEYTFTPNNDGSADLKMTTLFRDGNLNGGAEKYVASRSIFVYVTKDGSSTETIAYKTNVFRAVTLVPPKTSGSVVLKYNQELTPEKVQAAITEAGNVNTERSDKKSVNDQLSGAFTQNINVKSDDAYDKTTFNAINTETSAQGATDKTYVAGAKTLNTYMVTDLGFKSQAIPLTVARYDTRIDKPTVEDPTNVSQEVKTDIIKKLAALNNVAQDKVSINDKGEAVIHFDGVDEKDAPKIALKDLVLKNLKAGEYVVPSDDKAVFVANPLDYSKDEIARIKQAIFDANKTNKDLNLTSVDQISLEYLKGDFTKAGQANQGISNGQAENTITVKIKTDKAVAEFTSNVKESKLTKLPDIRKDYDVSWTKTKIDGRDTDEGISWSNDQKTTIIYRYDPTKAEGFDTTKILGLLKATPKDKQAGLRDLTGGETLQYEGTGTNAQKSHMHYALQNGEPTGELTLGNMGGPYWSGNQKVSNSDVDLGDAESEAGSYSWDTEAGPVKVAGKKGKIFKARLFVEPYAMTYYKHVYMEQGRNPGNTAKAINVIFVPQTNHKTKDLSDSIGEHKTENVEGKDVPTQSKYYNASADKKDAYEKALKTATDLLATVKDKQEKDLTEEQKAQIDNATINLNKARAELDGADTNKDKLNDSIDANGKAAEGTTAATGTQATNQFKNVSDPDFKKADGSDDKDRNEAAKKAKTDYDKALEEANKVKEDKNATQKAVDDAKAKLDAAREKLNDFTTNKDELNNAIAKDGKVNTGRDNQGNQTLTNADPTYQNSTPEQRKAYDDAVKKADEVFKDPNASQKEVNKAIDDLKKAKAALDANATDKAPLAAAVQKSLDKDPNKHSVFYTNAKNKTGDTAAQQAVKNYDDALAKAKQVLADDKATKKDVEDAKKALEDAEKVLYAETYQTKATDLAEAIADNFSGYLMPAYFNAFDKAQAEGKDSQAAKDFKAYNDAYHAAKDLMDELNKPGSTVDQKKVDAVKEQLIAARKIIDTYATDTSRLSAAALNDFAIQHSPAYANLKELAEKQNPSEEEKAKVEAAKKAKEAYEKAAAKLTAALTNTLPKDQANGHDIPDNIIPKEDGDPNDKDYLKDIQAHKNGEPLNRDVDTILKEMNEAAKALDKFATKTDELIKSINEDATTHPSPAFKNASQPSFQKPDGSGPDDAKNAAAKAAADAYGKALNEAKDLLIKKPDATQKEINDAKAALDKARAELDKYNTDVAKLKASVKKHGTKADVPAPEEGTLTSDAYRNASDPHFMKEQDGKLVPDDDKNNKAAADKKAYDEALTKAQELLKKHDDKDTPQDAKPTQKEIDEALKTLDEARKKLEDNYKTVTTGLETEINKSTAEHAPAVTEGDFEATPEFKNAQAKTSDGNENADVTAYKNALANARKLVSDAKDTNKKNSERPTQQQINDAFDALTAAKKQITDNYKTNFEALTSAKDFADDGFKKTPEYQNALAKKTAGDPGATNDLGETGKDTGFENVLNQIKQKLNDDNWKKTATQKSVNNLLKKLQAAQDKIANNYKTDAKLLENEVGDKDAQGQPVTPPFEASVEYKNALEKKNAGDATATEKLKAYAEKLAKANELIEKVKNPDPNAKPEDRPTQKQVDDALAALKKAKKDIDDNFKTKVDALKKETKELKDDGGAKPDTEKFEKSTEYQNALAKKGADSKDNADIQAYNDALAKANELLDLFDESGNPKANIPAGKQLPTQQEVDEALKNLKEIKDKITKNYVTSPHDLQEEVDKSKGGDTDTRTDVFENTPEFKNATAKGDDAAKKALDDYNKKLKAAKDLLDKFDRTTGKPKTDLPDGTKVPTQKQLDDALKDLQAAKKKIADDYKTDPSKLKTEADADAKFRDSVFFMIGMTEDIDAYNKALAEANSVLKDPNATQAEVDAALKKLQAAKYKINHPFGIGSGVGSGSGYDADASDSQSASVDKTALRVEVNNSEADSSAASKANTAAARAYVKALAEAKRVLADKNATQAQVDAALRNLKAAKAALRNASGNAGGLAKTGAATGLFASLAAIFSGLGAAGVASRRRKHSNE
ncbi:FIVAR domain-containing protein [Gardnerella vaginalis]|uniref:FIVAR domain-containing protein n=1 Tax=Gardnerella swidsinskii TaxID=2792979 RepID=UPI001573BE31|nr:FIVAR domain-containing protein [Gardnerella vaginalis]